jgi:hypothetical protein
MPVSRLLVPTNGTGAWKARLADPEKHWKREASAFETAVSWELAAKTYRGLPQAVAEVLDQVEELRDAKLLFALPEHKVPLPGGSRPSQTDVWALLKSQHGLISMAVEAKAEEVFGDTIEDWEKDASDGKRERLLFLHKTLKCETDLPKTLRYQLVHRTASAILEAQRTGALYAVMMVQAFRETTTSEKDYVAFGDYFKASLMKGKIVQLGGHTIPKLFLGWAVNPLCTDRDIARAAV